ncbi:bolA-like protein DDB_G0274439 isoform X1 [Artemia franciscana]|uniref:bolA-like protein DDB_G0274439 isoform X1 n=1 Tax=Artemia franciscana TaxID=6661 RepID=UPI0032DA17FF
MLQNFLMRIRINALPKYIRNCSSISGQDQIKTVLAQRFPDPSEIVVEDISGGCGAMYAVFVASKEFKGLPVIKQHKLVKEALKEEIKAMHGIRVQTEAQS